MPATTATAARYLGPSRPAWWPANVEFKAQPGGGRAVLEAIYAAGCEAVRPEDLPDLD
jgi:hypothetical protein